MALNPRVLALLDFLFGREGDSRTGADPKGRHPGLAPAPPAWWRTRRSLVGHYVPVDVPVYNATAFFNPADELPDRTKPYIERRLVASAPAYFQTSYLAPE